MSGPRRIADAITTHSRLVLVSLLVATALVGAGVTALETDTSLEQFESESTEREALEYVERNFATAEGNTTAAQLLVEDENVLTQESLVQSLAFQQAIREHDSVGPTLADDEPTVGLENVVATAVIREERGAELEVDAAALERRAEAVNERGERLEEGLDRTVAIQESYEELNASRDAGAIDDETYDRRAAELEAAFDEALENATIDLDGEDAARYERAVAQLRTVTAEIVAIEREHEEPRGSVAARLGRLETARDRAYADGTVGILGEEYRAIRAERERLEAERAALESRDQPPLSEQQAALESLTEAEYEATLEELLDGEGPIGDLALRFLPASYEPGSTSAEARSIVVVQSTDEGAFEGPGTIEERIVESQLELRALAAAHEESYLVFGFGVVVDEIDRSIGDSLWIVGPLALALVVLTLSIAYRDPLDISLGVAGIAVVLLWTFGFMGWAGIAFNQLFVAVPVLLVGLSIDYAIHVFMRHRERRSGDDADVRGSMAGALAGVGVALVWVTATTAVGFLANLVSPIDPVGAFGLVSAVGILAALLVFGALVPAAKVELDEALEARGIDRRKRAFGTGGGRAARALSAGSTAARRAPFVVLACALLVTAGGVYGATGVDTSFDQEEFLATEPPAWTEKLPAPFAPGEYRSGADLAYVTANFQREDARAQLLVTGDVTDGETLSRIAEAEAAAAESEHVYVLPNGEADVRSPLSLMEEVAAEDESFNASFQLADRTGDGVPDQNHAGLYDRLFELDPDAAADVIARTEDGEYEAVRLVVSVRGDADRAATAAEIRSLEAAFDEDGAADGRTDGSVGTADGAGFDPTPDGRWSGTATGTPLINDVVEKDLFETVFWSLLVTLVVVVGVLSLAYRLTGHGASLGAVTLLPVAFAVAWILATMALLEIPFNVLTGMITSLTIGLGVAYSIHVSARYTAELERQGCIRDALETTVTGTGGALLGSAATTVLGFGTLALAILPVLRQFGLVTALTILYAFLASVLVLPSLLVCWTRWLGPDVPLEATPSERPPRPATDGDGSRLEKEG
ncbi:MMPL family transporter [Natronobeatus ordinarius]|uniref:MMPL family transporter n=1 Tax=Natronobeatus ordinarius TaxID=2963433 RepID=UPI0020CF8503|nr:MMPL family transporter [Natronobeatus ordinarius]